MIDDIIMYSIILITTITLMWITNITNKTLFISLILFMAIIFLNSHLKKYQWYNETTNRNN